MDKDIYYCQLSPSLNAFGSYTGNGSTDGPFIHTGFVLLVHGGSPYQRQLGNQDSTRSINNPVDNAALITHMETTLVLAIMNFLSNGVKIRSNEVGLTKHTDLCCPSPKTHLVDQTSYHQDK